MLSLLISIFLSPAAIAGGGVSAILIETEVVASCNSGQVTFEKQLWEYDGFDLVMDWALVVRKNGERFTFTSRESNELFDKKGSKLSKIVRLEREDENENFTTEEALLETSVSFDGSPGAISARLATKKKTILFKNLAVNDCYRN